MDPKFPLEVSRWFRDNSQSLPTGVEAELREASGELPLASASIQFSSPLRAVLFVVWENGAAETISASAFNDDPPEVTVLQLHRPDDIVPILDRVRDELSRAVGES